jgi:hypothetical protein
MLRTPLARMGLGIVVALMAGAAQGVPITFAFSGTITQINDSGDALGGDVLIGDTFTGTYTFESTLSDSVPGPSVGQYLSATSVMRVSVGAFDVFSGNHTWLSVYNYSAFDALWLQASDFDSDGLHANGMAVSLSDTTASVFPDDSLPLMPPPLAAFDPDQRRFGLEARRLEGNTSGFYISGVIETLTPEPASLSLFAAGAVSLGLVRPRRR